MPVSRGRGSSRQSYHDVFRRGPMRPKLLGTVALLFACVLIGWVASARININEFSLHHFYKNRLVRCYLGASRTGLRGIQTA